jgi:hypothetical protein
MNTLNAQACTISTYQTKISLSLSGATLPAILGAIVACKQATKARLHELASDARKAAEAVEQARAAVESADKAGKADARAYAKEKEKVLRAALSAVQVHIAGEYQQAHADARELCELAEKAARDAGDHTVADTWKWSSSAAPNSKKYKNALFQLKAMVQDISGLELAYDKGADKWAAKPAPAKAAKAAKAVPVKTPTDGGSTLEPIAQGKAATVPATDADARQESSVTDNAATIPMMVSANRQAYLLAIARCYASKSAMLAAIRDLPVDAFGEQADELPANVSGPVQLVSVK